jgi:hypothetical protein
MSIRGTRYTYRNPKLETEPVVRTEEAARMKRKIECLEPGETYVYHTGYLGSSCVTSEKEIFRWVRYFADKYGHFLVHRRLEDEDIRKEMRVYQYLIITRRSLKLTVVK